MLRQIILALRYRKVLFLTLPEWIWWGDPRVWSTPVYVWSTADQLNQSPFFFHFLAEKWCLTLWWLVYAVICEFSQCKLTSGAQAMVCVKFSLLHFSEHLHLLVINIMYRVDKNWGRRSSACVGQRAKFLHGSSPYIIPCLYHKYHNDIVVQLSQ